MKKIFLLIFSVIFSGSIYGQENDILLRNFRFYHKQEVLYREITTVIYNTLTEEVKLSEFMTNLEIKTKLKFNSIETVLSVYANKELLDLNENDRLNIIKFLNIFFIKMDSIGKPLAIELDSDENKIIVAPVPVKGVGKTNSLYILYIKENEFLKSDSLIPLIKMTTNDIITKLRFVENDETPIRESKTNIIRD